MKFSSIMITMVILVNAAAWADCTDGYPTAWLIVYWNSNPNNTGDQIVYQAYIHENEYKLAVTDVGDWWDGRISAFDCWDDYPADWCAYDHPECNGSQSGWYECGAGDKNLEHDDDLGSLTFECPSDKDRVYFVFCEHDDCDSGKVHPIHLYKSGNSYEVVWEIRELDGHWNDKISAVESGINDSGGYFNGKHAHWYFYKDKNYNSNGNANLTLTDDEDFQYVGDSLNDQITSLRLVISANSTPPAVQSSIYPAVAYFPLSVDFADVEENVAIGIAEPNIALPGFIWNGPFRAAKFDGAESVLLPDLNNMVPPEKAESLAAADFTVSFWMKTDQLGSTALWTDAPALVSADISDFGDWGICLQDKGGDPNSVIVFSVQPLDSFQRKEIKGNTIVNDDQWHYVVCVRNKTSGNFAIYVDGLLDAEYTGADVIGPVNSGNAVRLGHGLTPSSFYDGLMTDLAFFDWALSAQDIYSMYMIPASMRNPGDLNNDDHIDLSDLEFMSRHWLAQ